jgi:tetratricopeptide (TPR) repeat protein
MRLLALSLALGLLATQAVAEVREEVRILMAEAASMKPADFPTAMRQYLLLREADALVERALAAGPPVKELAPLIKAEAIENRAGRIKAAAARVGGFCEGRGPRDCLLEEAEALMAKPPEVDRDAEDEGAIGASGAGRRIAVFLAKAGLFDEGLRVARGIGDPDHRNRAVRDIVILLAKDRQFEKALETARETVPHPHQIMRISQALNAILGHFVAGAHPSAEGREAALESMSRAAALAGRIGDEFGRSEALARLSWLYLDLGEIDRAEALMAKIDDDHWRGVVKVSVARRLAEDRAFAAAERRAATVDEDADLRAEAFQTVAVELAKTGQLAEARRVAGRIDGPVDHVVALGAVAQALGEAQQAAEVFAEAEGLARGIEDRADRGDALGKLAWALIRAGESPAGEAIAAELRAMEVDPARTARALQRIADALQDTGQREAALRYALQAEGPALKIADPEERSDWYLEIARLLIRLGAHADAERVAAGIENATRRAFALKDLGVALAKSGHFAEATRIAALIGEIEGAEKWRGSEIAWVAEALAAAGDVAGAEAVADSIVEPIRRNEARAEVALALVEGGRLVEAERIAQGIEDAGWRSVALASIAAELGG